MLFVVSDTLTQQLVEKKRWNHDGRRTLRMGIMGIIVGPIQRTWFLTLERFIPPTSKIQIVKKLIVDQTIYGPFIIFFFYSLSGILAGKELREVKLLLQERYIKTMLTGYKIWPLVQAVNFSCEASFPDKNFNSQTRPVVAVFGKKPNISGFNVVLKIILYHAISIYVPCEYLRF